MGLQTAKVISRLRKWKDPTMDDFEHITVVDKKMGVKQANYQRTFVGLGDYNKVCAFIVSLQKQLN